MAEISIEARGYGPDSTLDEVAAIRARVWKIRSGLLMFHEMPVQTPFSMDVLFDELEALAGPSEPFIYIVNLTGARRPGAEVRLALRRRVARIRARVPRVMVVVGDNIIMRAMVKLVAHSMSLPPLTLCSTRREALEELEAWPAGSTAKLSSRT